jgi:hypothetical protein
LHICGDGVARGYLNRPDLTAEKFIANPFAAGAASRLYKTGDLARYLPDGNIEFLGRMDHQVKIRGYRIEPAEIETALARHRAIKESVVVSRDDSLGSRALVAYVVADPASLPSVDELRALVRQTLPDYMMPSAFEFLSSLPLTPNGKLDRGALPAPGRGRPNLDEDYSPPRTPLEVWADVLTLDQVGVHDNFFALGGNSLRAMQMIARLRHVLNKEIFVSDIFSHGTIAELAASLAHRADKAAALTAESIQPRLRQGRLPLSFAQERVWFIQKLYPSSVAYHFRLARAPLCNSPTWRSGSGAGWRANPASANWPTGNGNCATARHRSPWRRTTRVRRCRVSAAPRPDMPCRARLPIH